MLISRRPQVAVSSAPGASGAVLLRGLEAEAFGGGRGREREGGREREEEREGGRGRGREREGGEGERVLWNMRRKKTRNNQTVPGVSKERVL